MSASKAKGSRFEREVVDYLKSWYPHAERRALCGTKDKGDIVGVWGWVLELKNTRTIDLAAAVDEAEIECEHAGEPWFAAVVKRRRRGVSESYVVMPLSQFARVAAALGAAKP